MRVAPTSNSNGLLAIGAQPLVEEADADFEVVLAEAIELHGRTPTPFESARTELCLGERLRRARRRADVRPAEVGPGEFERLGSARCRGPSVQGMSWRRRARSSARATPPRRTS